MTAGTAYDFGANADPVSAYLSDLYTVPASLAGLPGISVPCGIHSNGRPLGFQLLGETFSEAVCSGSRLPGSVKRTGIFAVRPVIESLRRNKPCSGKL